MLTDFYQLSWLLLMLFTINGFTIILILFLKNRILKATQFLLALNLLGVTLASVVICLVETKLIVKVPFLFRLPSPVYYLMFPAAFLYVKLIVTDRVQLNKLEYLHFVPAVIHLIEMMPFYLKSNAEKIIRINSVLNNDIYIYAHNEGWLPNYYHNIIRGFMAILYSVAMWRLLQHSKTKMNVPNKIYYEKTLQWLKIFILMNGILGIVIIQSLAFTFLPSEIRSLELNLTFILILIISNYYLFFHPEILYGLPHLLNRSIKENDLTKNNLTNINDKVHQNESSGLEDESVVNILIDQNKVHINNYILKNQSFLNPNVSIIDLSRETNIPVHHLKLLINKAEGKRFNDFMNQFRIDYMQTQINNGALLNKTLESLAIECGFSSKPAFIRGIKKLTNLTPGVYFKPKKSSASQGIP